MPIVFLNVRVYARSTIGSAAISSENPHSLEGAIGTSLNPFQSRYPLVSERKLTYPFLVMTRVFERGYD
jgi:hypothetical protein